jgi:Flp pilus assembly protein TadD
MPVRKKKAQLTFQISFLESLYKQDTDDPRLLEMLASAYTEAGRIDDGLALDRRHVEIEPENPSAHYNLACSLALKEEREEALNRLRKALELGFSDIAWLRRDPDLKGLHSDPVFRSLLQQFAQA